MAQLTAYLTVYRDVQVIYDGQVIDPDASILRRDEYDLQFTPQGAPTEAATLRILEWSMKTDRELHLRDADGITVDITDFGIQAPGFQFTAYVLWEQMPEHQSDFLLGEGRLDSHVGALITTARDKLREHFKARAVEQLREVVQQLPPTEICPGAVTAKWGVRGLMRTAALENAPPGIRVNTLCPGMTATAGGQGWADSFPDQAEHVKAQIPMRRLGKPEEPANAAVWLCSNKASYTTGGGPGRRRRPHPALSTTLPRGRAVPVSGIDPPVRAGRSLVSSPPHRARNTREGQFR